VITKEGLKIVDQVSDVFEKDELLAKNLTKEEAIQLNDLLDKFRG
jgi:DNA-binding MarR family transcriptional regulator